MIPKRQLEILKIIIEDYVDSGSPVGSKYLISTYGLPYSSATIRNEMAALEHLGLLEKTHTSSGRVPSIEGYRYYANKLAEREIAGLNHIVGIDDIFERGQLFSDVLEKSAKLLSDMTGCAVVYLGPNVTSRRFSNLRVINLSGTQSLIIMQTDDGQTVTEIFPYIGNLTQEVLEKLVEVCQGALENEVLPRVVRKLEVDIKPLFLQYSEHYIYLHRVLLNLVGKLSTQEMHISGVSQLLKYSEFIESKSVSTIFEVLESKERLNRIIHAYKPSVSITLGDEIGYEGLENCSIVTKAFQTNGGISTLSIIGPMRMNYPEMLVTLDYIAQQITNY